jgi:hypothetical protein
MPLIIKANGQRVYSRGGNGQAHQQLYGVLGWSHIKDRSEVANLFSFGYLEPCFSDGSRYVPGIRDEILVFNNELDYQADKRRFGGLMTNVEDRVTHKTGSGYAVGYRFECASFDILLDKEIRQPLKAGMTWQELLIFLLQSHFSGVISTDYSFIQNTIAAPPIRINNGSVRTLLSAMRSLTGHDYFVDEYRRLHVQQSANQPGTFQLNDTPDSGFMAWDSLPVISREGRALYNIVRQPFQNQVSIDEWDGETFTGKGDPKGQGGQLPLLRTPTDSQESTFLDERFDGSIFGEQWIEFDDTATHHVDYPNQGWMFPAEGQCQIVGGTGTLGGVALFSTDFYQYVESAYLVQEFQLTNATGEGYICLFTTGTTSGDFKAGLRVLNGALKALDGTTLIASLGTTDNYILWVTMTADGWQYDILGGSYATKQTIRTETGITHETDYRIAPIVNKNMQGSINSVRYRKSDRGLVLEINGQKKTVGLESSDTDLPDIDAFLNVDETPALLKFRAAEDLSVIASVASATVFNVAVGQGVKFKIGQRLLIGDNIVEEFNGKAGIVANVATDTITLVSPGITGLAMGQQILINTTVPAAGDKIVVRYGYAKSDEATAYDSNSIDQYGPLPVTLDEKEHLKTFDDAQMEAENYLSRYKDGILKIALTSNDSLIRTEPDSLTAIPVLFTRRPDGINKTLILNRVEVTPVGNGGKRLAYNLTLESADPITPFDDLVRNRSLIIGSNGEIRLTLGLTDSTVSDVECFVTRIDSAYITWANPAKRRWGEFKWKPDESIPTETGGGEPYGLLLAITKPSGYTPPAVNPSGGQPVGLLLAITQPGVNPIPQNPTGTPVGLLLTITKPS